MKNLDLQVIQQALEWLGEGQSVWLCTVLSTFGSAPRGPGAMLVALASGASRGSLSGGCVEDDFLERLGKHEFAGLNEIVRYGEGGLAPSLALPCGGVLDVLVERFEPKGESTSHFSTLLSALNGRTLVVREIRLNTAHRYLYQTDSVGAAVSVTESVVQVRIGAAQRLLIAGLSPVAEFCASFGVSLGYEVIVCDPRSEMLAQFRLDGATVVERFPATYISEGGCHAATAVVALTHDPRMDDLTLLEAVRTPAFYIGAMGSRRTSENRLERISRIGQLDGASLARINAPIGLKLGSKTPAEIALAVMADIVRVKNGAARDTL